MQYQIILLKSKDLAWIKKWKVNQNSAVREVKEIGVK